MLGALFSVVEEEEEDRSLVTPILKGPKLKSAPTKNARKPPPHDFLDIVDRAAPIRAPTPAKAKKGRKAKVHLSIAEKKERKAAGITKGVATWARNLAAKKALTGDEAKPAPKRKAPKKKTTAEDPKSLSNHLETSPPTLPPASEEYVQKKRK